MSTMVNPRSSASISIGGAVRSIAEWLRKITVKVSGDSHSHGSGVIWNSAGLVVTNAHVASAELHRVELPDGTLVESWIAARDAKLDLAALIVEARGLTAACTRSAESLRTGEMVIAMGNPWDGVNALSVGIVHAPAARSRWLVADIHLAPGNSGGPLVDSRGNVVGVNSMVVNGFGVAIPSDRVHAFLVKAGLAVA